MSAVFLIECSLTAIVICDVCYIVGALLFFQSTVEYPAGIVASLVRAVLNERKRSLYGYSPLQPIGPISHIENPLLSFARAGLGILSQGLGRYEPSDSIMQCVHIILCVF